MTDLREKIEASIAALRERVSPLVPTDSSITNAVMQVMREQEPAILSDEAYELGLDAIPYYAAPTPPSVPEGWQLVPDAKQLSDHKSAAYVLGWNECRAAMLAAAKPGEPT